MKATIGRIVHYTLTEQDANNILAQRQRATESGPQSSAIGNYAAEGQVYPAVVVRVFDPSSGTANLKVMLDGNDTYWATSRKEGAEPGTWAWPPRVG
jgi:hypothetical protein